MLMDGAYESSKLQEKNVIENSLEALLLYSGVVATVWTAGPGMQGEDKSSGCLSCFPQAFVLCASVFVHS